MADEQEIRVDTILALPWHAPDNPSSQIARMAYVDEQVSSDLFGALPAESLIVQFHTKAADRPSYYLYKQVPPEVYAEVKSGGATGSSGKALNASVKGHFEYARVVVGHDATEDDGG